MKTTVKDCFVVYHTSKRGAFSVMALNTVFADLSSATRECNTLLLYHYRVCNPLDYFMEYEIRGHLRQRRSTLDRLAVLKINSRRDGRVFVPAWKYIEGRVASSHILPYYVSTMQYVEPVEKAVRTPIEDKRKIQL